MSTEAICFLFGLAAMGYCALVIKKGWIAGPWGLRLERDQDTVFYWLCWACTTAIALGLVVLPVLTWLGIRE